MIWTHEEIYKLHTIYGVSDKPTIINSLPGHTWNSIKTKAQRLGLRMDLTKKNRRRWVDDAFFSSGTEEALYWAGFIAADGCVRTRGYGCVVLALSERDGDHLAKLRDRIAPTHPLGVGKRRNGSLPTRRLELTSAPIADALARFGIGPRKTLTLQFPKHLSTEEARHFIRGYSDGDGCITTKTQGTLRWSVLGTEQFLLSVVEHLPIETRVFRKDNTRIYKFAVSHRKAQQSLEWLYKDATIFLERKYLLWQAHKYNNT